MNKKTLICLMLALNMAQSTCFATDLKIGSKGVLVEQLQLHLFEMGYLPFGEVDGIFGNITKQALKLYQSHNNLEDDGIYGERTQLVLEKHIRPLQNNIRVRIIEEAFSYLGVRYKWGGNSRSEGVDCSGLVKNVFNKVGYHKIRRTADKQYDDGRPINKQQLLPGDLVFFDTSNSKDITHVGIFVGCGDRFIHAGLSSGVTVSSLNNPYWRPRYMCACRILNC